jgi:hypothetical protein
MDKRLLTLSIFVSLVLLVVLGAVFVLKNHFAIETKAQIVPSSETESKNLISSPIDNYQSDKVTSNRVLAAVGTGDSRSVIVDNFLAKHSSPMSGLGSVFVSTADRYGLDYRLLPAIAFQESTLGRYMPRNSHNAWGWAIYTGENSGARFKNWSQAIDIVARGIKYDYIDRGLHTPEAIMTRYTDNNDGSWAFGVKYAMEEMAPR